MIRTAFVAIVAALTTVALVILMLFARLFHVRKDRGSVYDFVPTWWARVVLGAAGVRVRAHGLEHAGGPSRVYVCNHVSWFDPPAFAAVLPGPKYVAKAEVFKVPVFGAGIRMLDMIPLPREQRKAALAVYDAAATRIRNGTSVVIFPEGTRGASYPLRGFKKGPFVLAIKAGATIVPVVIHGTIEALPRGSLRIRPAEVNVHFLKPVAADGYPYERRHELLSIVRERMKTLLRETYGINADDN